MQTPKNGWEMERAASWLRRHGWGGAGEERPAELGPETIAAAQAAGAAAEAAEEDIDIAGWPALVAPFYD